MKRIKSVTLALLLGTLGAYSARADQVIVHTNIGGATSLGDKFEASSIRTDRSLAYKLARQRNLASAAAANPDIVAGIAAYQGPAKVMAKNPHLGDIAKADHYLCRRLAKWKGAARRMARNGQVDQVIALDPSGIYEAIKNDKKIARILAKNPTFGEIMIDNPDLGEYLSSSM